MVHEAEEFDWVGFSRFMRKVSLAEAKLYFKMTYLCKFAYMVPRIKVTTQSTKVDLSFNLLW